MTLKRLLICLVIILCFVLGFDAYGSVQQTKWRESCLVNMKGLHSALVLYRADNDGYSPISSERAAVTVDTGLAKYAGGHSVTCPSPLETYAPPNYEFRQTYQLDGTNTKYAFGADKNSVIAECYRHIAMRKNLRFNGFRPHFVPLVNVSSPGFMNVLFRNGTAKSVPMRTQRRVWLVRNGVFTEMPSWRPGMITPGNAVTTFDFEPSPPRFERKD